MPPAQEARQAQEALQRWRAERLKRGALAMHAPGAEAPAMHARGALGLAMHVPGAEALAMHAREALELAMRAAAAEARCSARG